MNLQPLRGPAASLSQRLRQATQRGASLIEVLVAILILSFGVLALGGMLAYAVQLPKLAGYRATATMLASSHIERMRANRQGFETDAYAENNTYNAALNPVVPCVYPACTAASLAILDKDETSRAIRRDLPQGGMRVACSGPCTNGEGDIWIMWQEPSTAVSIGGVSSDECPDSTVLPEATNPFPRCLHLRFKL